jgi:subtilisin-like proprotein convertase family protein
LFAEPRVDGTDNYTNYVFTSRRHFEEMSAGTWTIKIADLTPQFAATWTSFRLNVYGTP